MPAVPWSCILNQLRAYSHLPGWAGAQRLTRQAAPLIPFRTSRIPFPCNPLRSVLHPTNCCSGPLQERISAVRNMVESELADSLIKVAEDRRVADEQLMEVSVDGGGEAAGLAGFAIINFRFLHILYVLIEFYIVFLSEPLHEMPISLTKVQSIRLPVAQQRCVWHWAAA